MEILSAMIGGLLAIAGVVVSSLFQAKQNRLENMERAKKEMLARQDAGRRERIAALNQAVSVIYMLRREMGLTALVASLDARETSGDFEKRYRKVVDFIDSARIGLLGGSDALSAEFREIDAAVSYSWGAFRNVLELNTKLEQSIDRTANDDYQRAFDRAFKSCDELGRALGDASQMASEEIKVLLRSASS